jgi:hypothetical protein
LNSVCLIFKIGVFAKLSGFQYKMISNHAVF